MTASQHFYLLWMEIYSRDWWGFIRPTFRNEGKCLIISLQWNAILYISALYYPGSDLLSSPQSSHGLAVCLDTLSSTPPVSQLSAVCRVTSLSWWWPGPVRQYLPSKVNIANLELRGIIIIIILDNFLQFTRPTSIRIFSLCRRGNALEKFLTKIIKLKTTLFKRETAGF